MLLHQKTSNMSRCTAADIHGRADFHLTTQFSEQTFSAAPFLSDRYQKVNLNDLIYIYYLVILRSRKTFSNFLVLIEQNFSDLKLVHPQNNGLDFYLYVYMTLILLR